MNRRDFLFLSAAAVTSATLPAVAIATIVAPVEDDILYRYLAGCVQAGYLSIDDANELLLRPDDFPWSGMPCFVHIDPPFSSEEFALDDLGASLVRNPIAGVAQW